MEWVTFWDLYQAAVHNNDQISEIKKFTYLQTLLAKEYYSWSCLNCCQLFSIALLESRFGNKERIISKHMDALLALESVSWQGNTMALRSLYDKVETHLRALKALGVSSEAYNSLLPSVLMRKLPSELCLNISRHVLEDTWNLDNLMNVLGDELKARERAAPEAKRSGSDTSHSHGKPRKTGGGKMSTEKEGSESKDSLNPKAEPFKSLSLFADSKGTILLQTAKATCFNLEDKRMRTDITLYLIVVASFRM